MMKTRHSLRKAVPSTPPVKTTKAVKRPAKESPQKNSSSNSQSPSAPVVPAKTIRHSLRNLELPEDEKVKEKVKVAPTKPAADPKDEDEEVEVEPTEPMKKRKAGRPFKIATPTVATPTARQSLRKTKAIPEDEKVEVEPTEPAAEKEDEKVEVAPTEPAAEPEDEKVEVEQTEPVKKRKAGRPFKIATTTVATPTARQSLRKTKATPEVEQEDEKVEDEVVEVAPTEPVKKRKAGRPFKIATNTVATPTARQSLRKTKATPEVEQEDEKVEVEPTESAAEPKDEKVEVAPTEPVKKKKAEKPPILSLELFYQTIRSSGEMSERWVLNEPIYDVSLNSNVIMFNELDVTMDGELRVKRGVKLLENRSFKILLDSVDMTHLFDFSKKIENIYQLEQLLYKVQMKKVCTGLRNYVPSNSLSPKEAYPVRRRGTGYYSKDCTVVVQKVFMGNSCSACSKIRNQMKRRAQNETRRRIHIKPPPKIVKSSFGKAVYSTLNDFIWKGGIPSSQYPRENMVYDDKLSVYLNQDLQARIEESASMPPPPPPPPKLSIKMSGRKRSRSGGNRGMRYQPSSTMTSTSAHNMQGIQEFITEDGQICYVTNLINDPNQGMMEQMTGLGEGFQWGQMMVEKFEPPEMDEIMTMGDNGNIIIQNIKGESFQMAEGEEYELIGEAQPTVDPMDMMSADNQQIQIIEVDDETLAQIQVHEGMDNMQIAHVDPNDPNFRQILRAFQAQNMAFE